MSDKFIYFNAAGLPVREEFTRAKKLTALLRPENLRRGHPMQYVPRGDYNKIVECYERMGETKKWLFNNAIARKKLENHHSDSFREFKEDVRGFLPKKLWKWPLIDSVIADHKRRQMSGRGQNAKVYSVGGKSVDSSEMGPASITDLLKIMGEGRAERLESVWKDVAQEFADAPLSSLSKERISDIAHDIKAIVGHAPPKKQIRAAVKLVKKHWSPGA